MHIIHLEYSCFLYFVMIKDWKQLKCLLVRNKLTRRWCIHNVAFTLCHFCVGILLLFIIRCIYIYCSIHVNSGNQKSVLDPLELGLHIVLSYSMPTWVLGTEPGPCRRAASSFSCWATSSAPRLNLEQKSLYEHMACVRYFHNLSF